MAWRWDWQQQPSAWHQSMDWQQDWHATDWHATDWQQGSSWGGSSSWEWPDDKKDPPKPEKKLVFSGYSCSEIAEGVQRVRMAKDGCSKRSFFRHRFFSWEEAFIGLHPTSKKLPTFSGAASMLGRFQYVPVLLVRFQHLGSGWLCFLFGFKVRRFQVNSYGLKLLQFRNVFVLLFSSILGCCPWLGMVGFLTGTFLTR